MLKITVKYFLLPDGILYFDKWYEKVFNITSLQDGFISLNRNKEYPIVYLCFENEEKLSAWSSTKIHDELATEIEPYFAQSPEVTIE